MRKLLALALFAVAAAPVVPTLAGGKPEPVTSVTLAKSWDAAVEEAKLLNVPIVVHSHGFFCGPCWGMHSALMCNKKYIDFANDNTVEVISLDRLQEGIDKKDRKAETYDAKVDGQTVKYMVEFPGLTIEDMLALASSKAASYNKTGKIPYTAVVDPWTLDELKSWNGGQGAGTIQETVLEAKKAMEKEHGKGIARKDLTLVRDAAREADAKAAKGDFAAALDRLAKLDAKAEKWADGLKEQLKTAKANVVAAAEKALAAIEEKKATDAAAAKKELSTLATRLKGTGLEEKAKELLATL